METIVDPRQSYNKSEQALLNEYKGNIFEYLVGLELSKLTEQYENYILNISPEFRTMFSIQEKYIRTRFPNLLIDLPCLAKELAPVILGKINAKEFQSIELTGKSKNSFDRDDVDAGADIIIRGHDAYYPVSLKLSKSNAFVNTKSGGIKSFIQKYFYFSESQEMQIEFNQSLDRLFQSSMMELHQCMDVEYDDKFLNWRQEGLCELPGELPSEARAILHRLYSELSQELETYMRRLFSIDKQQFISSLAPLIGVAGKETIQAICYYQSKQGHYQSEELFCKSGEELLSEMSLMKFVKSDSLRSSFEIEFPSKILQIRIKPMNKFTAMAFKINCSVKHVS